MALGALDVDLLNPVGVRRDQPVEEGAFVDDLDTILQDGFPPGLRYLLCHYSCRVQSIHLAIPIQLANVYISSLLDRPQKALPQNLLRVPGSALPTILERRAPEARSTRTDTPRSVRSSARRSILRMKIAQARQKKVVNCRQLVLLLLLLVSRDYYFWP